jgi:hypothetical protein
VAVVNTGDFVYTPPGASHRVWTFEDRCVCLYVCLLSAVCCLLSVLMLSVVCCLLSVVCCLLLLSVLMLSNCLLSLCLLQLRHVRHREPALPGGDEEEGVRVVQGDWTPFWRRYLPGTPLGTAVILEVVMSHCLLVVRCSLSQLFQLSLSLLQSSSLLLLLSLLLSLWLHASTHQLDDNFTMPSAGSTSCARSRGISVGVSS